MTTSIEI